MREGSPSLLLMTTTLPTTRLPKPLPTRAVVCPSRVLHCSLVSKASLGDSLMGPPPECLSSVHITHAHSARAVTVDVSRQSATNTDVRHPTRIIGRPPRSSSTPYTFRAPRVRERNRELLPLPEVVGLADQRTAQRPASGGSVGECPGRQENGAEVSRESCSQEGRYKANLAVHTLAA